MRKDNEMKMEGLIELRQKLIDVERRVGQIEAKGVSLLYKHEETFYLKLETC